MLAGLLNASLVTANLVAVLCYTLLTFRLLREAARQSENAQKQLELSSSLLKEAREQNEIAIKPIFAAITRGNQFSLRQVGLGPAFNFSLDKQIIGDQVITFRLPIEYMGPNDEQEFRVDCARREAHNGGTRGIMTILDANSLYTFLATREEKSPLQFVIRCTSLHAKAYVGVFESELY